MDQRCEEFACGSDPSGERGTVAVDALAVIDLRLPVEWLMIGMETRTCASKPGPVSPRSMGRWRSLHDPIAGVAAKLLAHTDDLKTHYSISAVSWRSRILPPQSGKEFCSGMRVTQSISKLSSTFS